MAFPDIPPSVVEAFTHLVTAVLGWLFGRKFPKPTNGKD